MIFQNCYPTFAPFLNFHFYNKVVYQCCLLRIAFRTFQLFQCCFSNYSIFKLAKQKLYICLFLQLFVEILYFFAIFMFISLSIAKYSVCLSFLKIYVLKCDFKFFFCKLIFLSYTCTFQSYIYIETQSYNLSKVLFCNGDLED